MPSSLSMNRNILSRRYDLDALRATAMLLGIVLHAGLSFTPFPWPVQDERQSGFFWLLFAAIHGFRMPVFFVLSGFFTAMLWRGRGLKSLLSHRFRRVLLPLLLGLVTIVPAVNWISGWAIASGLEANAAKVAEDTIWNAAKNGDLSAIERHLQDGADINGTDPASGQTPLVWVALLGQLEAVDWLLQNGAAVNGRTKDGGTPLHAAAFLGRVEVAKLLLQHGANIEAKNNNGDTPRAALKVDWELTRYLAGLLQIELDARQVKDGRVEIAGLFEQFAVGESRGKIDKAKEKSTGFLKAMASPIFAVPVFHHLWFLWFLWWLVLVFALYARLADWLKWQGPPKWLVLSPVRFLYLIPLTVIPQSLMGLVVPSFGPDTSLGLLPMPHIFLYYALFFFFGALYFGCDDPGGRVGKWWWLTLPLGLFIVFPFGLEFSTGAFGFRQEIFDPAMARSAAVALQAIYAWMMTFACMGLFRKLCIRENKTIRYVSDSSYWLYVAHLPLIIGAQLAVRDWPLSSGVKYFLVLLTVTGLLLLIYQFLVRYTWLGRLLNGPHVRPTS